MVAPSRERNQIYPPVQIDAIQKAKTICAVENKKYQIINKRVQPQGFAVFPEVNIVFKCE